MIFFEISSRLTIRSPVWGEVAKLLVGPDNIEFLVHKNLLVENSPFFAAKSRPCWANSGSSIDLSHVNVEGFEIVVGWLYSKRPLPEPVKTDASSGWPRYTESLIKAYKAADQLMVNELQNKLLDDFKELTLRHHRPTTCIDLVTVCNFDLSHTPCYRFVLKCLAWRFMSGAFDDDRLRRFNESLVYLAPYPDAIKDWLAHTAMWRNKPWADPRINKDCEFHVHAGGDQCSSEGRNTKKEGLGQGQHGSLLITID